MGINCWICAAWWLIVCLSCFCNSAIFWYSLYTTVWCKLYLKALYFSQSFHQVCVNTAEIFLRSCNLIFSHSHYVTPPPNMPFLCLLYVNAEPRPLREQHSWKTSWGRALHIWGHIRGKLNWINCLKIEKKEKSRQCFFFVHTHGLFKCLNILHNGSPLSVGEKRGKVLADGRWKQHERIRKKM